ncbi:Protein kinase-like domain superfamily protein [Abortiporus biennis]
MNRQAEISKSIASILPDEVNLVSLTQLASLWSNYGHIYRLKLSRSSDNDSCYPESIILKSIHPPPLSPGSNPSESHRRKLLSYDVEEYFYRNLSSFLSPSKCKVAKCYSNIVTDERSSNGNNLLLEDLSVVYPFEANGSLGKEGTEAVLTWLASFHGTYFLIQHHQTVKGQKIILPLIPAPLLVDKNALNRAEGLWKRGTYWYLETRREEMADIDANEHDWLLPWIEKVDDAIEKEIEKYGTLLHGDVKGANIVFNRPPYPHRQNRTKHTKSHSKSSTTQDDPLRCALYDFQYVGLGLPVHDLVYFLGTSIESSLLKSPSSEMELLKFYHAAFLEGINETHVTVAKGPGEIVYPFEVLLKHWDLAIVDWYRFMAGWGFWGNDVWVTRRAKDIVRKWEKEPDKSLDVLK